MNQPIFLPLLGAFCLFASACATGPHNFDRLLAAEDRDFAFFPAGAQYYGAIDKVRGKELYESFFPEDQIDNAVVRRMLKKTRTISFALYANRGEEGIAALLRGRYPALSSAAALMLDSNWERLTAAEGSFWHSKREHAALALRGTAILCLLGEVPKQNGAAAMPPGFEPFRRNAIASGWLPSAGFLAGLMERYEIPVTIPIQRLMFAVFARHEGMIFKVRLDTAGGTQAKLAAALFTLLQKNRDTLDENLRPLIDVLLANPVSVEGSSLTLTSAPVTREEAARIMRLLALS